MSVAGLSLETAIRRTCASVRCIYDIHTYGGEVGRWGGGVGK